MLEAWSRTRDGTRKLSANFTVAEFACKDGSDPVFVDSSLAALLQKIRDHFGRPVVITSGYRTAAHNKSVGGAPTASICMGALPTSGCRASRWSSWPPMQRPACPAPAASAGTRPGPDGLWAGSMWTPAPPKAAGQVKKEVNPMESILSALIAGTVTLIGVLIANSRSQAVTDTKLEELTREVREHNNFARRVPILEEQMKVANHRIADLENHERMKERN